MMPSPLYYGFYRKPASGVQLAQGRKAIILLFFMMLLPSLLTARIAPADTSAAVEEDIERALESFDPDDADIDPEALAQYLTDLAANPVNVNAAGLNELLGLPGINVRLAQGILEYRQQKPFESIDELQEVRGIGTATLERVRPYVTLGSRSALTRQLLGSPAYWTERGRLEYISRGQRVLQEQVGYTEPESEGQSRYAGSPWRYYQRLNYRSRRISMNLTQLKDPGEPLTGPADFDFNSWHLGIQNIGWVQQIIVGDFGLWTGQGLVFSTGLGFGKGRNVISAPAQRERGLAPYQSSEETRFMRGVGATIGGDFQLTGFYSRRPLSATEVAADTVRMPSSTGLHRTPTERARRFNTELRMYGGRATYSGTRGLVGASGYYAEYDNYILPRDALHNRYDFEGRQTSTIGLDYRLFVGEFVSYGEAARSQNGGMGMVAGLSWALDNETDITAVYRNYGKDFQSLFGSGFAEVGGLPRNEEGLYVGLAHQPADWLRLSGYFDQFRFPMPRFGTSQETTGYDMLGLAEFRFSRDLNVYVLARSKIRENDYDIIDPDNFNREIRVMGQDARTTLRTQLEYQLSPQLRSRTRFEWARGRDRDQAEAETGVMIFQDLRWRPVPRITIDMRMALFETESFTSRIYTFENDLLYTFSNTLLSGQGQRAYILLRYAAGAHLDFWIKYAATIYEDRRIIGSGLTESEGNLRSQLGLQMRVKF